MPPVLLFPLRSISFNSFLQLLHSFPVRTWHTRQGWVHSLWHNCPCDLKRKSTVEAFTECTSLHNLTLDSNKAEKLSLKWHRVSGFTEKKIDLMVRPAAGRIQYVAIFSSTTITVCNFCATFDDPQQKTSSSSTTAGQLRSIMLVLFGWEAVGSPA